ncbi:MAG: hypothetical protein HY544_01025 [Candidatus Diapherotrites archaeon]|uniref:DUF7718 domain-containing protein n=1 Tax=Candidatus Iainarchaeum sp. TaxID=3101447 RepID=A0A8T3YHR4_9ARCH|nr:hypothetical protein [Candidatus Diapherotrites archaeon]
MYFVEKRVKEFRDRLDDSGNEILFIILEFDNERRLKKFSLNLTTTICGKRFGVARYDCGHGYLHMHRFYRKPYTKELVHKEVSMQTVKELRKEMAQNWETWKKAFLENYGGTI